MLDFPSSPSIGQSYPSSPIAGVPTYQWDGQKWVIPGSGSGGGGAAVYVADTLPAGAADSALWWESDSGQLWIRYNDGDTTQWVQAVPQLDAGSFIAKSGDTMTGPLVLAADPASSLQAATKQYVDAGAPVGQCKLVATSATVATLVPFNGNGLKIDGVIRNLPAAGVALSSPTTVATTFYYIYAYWTGSAIAMEVSTTGHSKSTKASNIGVEIKTGDDSRTLVGMFYANTTTGGFEDNTGRRLFRGWFNDAGVTGGAAAGDVINNSLGSLVIATGTQAYVLAWAGEQFFASVGAQCFMNTVGQIEYVHVALNNVAVSAVAGIHQCAVASYQSWAQCAAAGNFATEGVNYFALGTYVSGGQGSMASRQMLFMTQRR